MGLVKYRRYFWMVNHAYKNTVMLGSLTDSQMEDLLKQQVTGRIACYADGETYIVPVNYVYRAPYIYSHTRKGKKIEMMRRNPKVCFGVDNIQNVFRWKSVLAWGEFEEISDIQEKERVMQALIHRIMPFANNPSDHPSHGIAERDSDIGASVEIVVYKIRIDRMTGRFEQN